MEGWDSQISIEGLALMDDSWKSRVITAYYCLLLLITALGS